MGWLIDPIEGQVWIYRTDQAVEVLAKPTQVLGDPVLADFVLDLPEFWDQDVTS